MYQLLDASWNSILTIIITAGGIYISVILLTRIFGLRSFSKMSSFDFAMTVAMGSLIATTILTQSVSLLQGLIGVIMVYCLQFSVTLLRENDLFKKAIDNTPLLLMDGSTILYDNLKKARVSESDLREKLREANVIELQQIRAVVFETTGDVSVLHANDTDRKLEKWLIEDVER